MCNALVTKKLKAHQFHLYLLQRNEIKTDSALNAHIKSYKQQFNKLIRTYPTLETIVSLKGLTQNLHLLTETSLVYPQ